MCVTELRGKMILLGKGMERNMKIGIMTFQDANNYGAVLQAYALNRKINAYEKCEIINYYNNYFHRNDRPRGIKSILLYFLHLRDIKRKNAEFDEFRKNYLKLSSDYIYDKDLDGLNSVYGVFVSGSDQVWNLFCSGNNDAYFLDFVKNNDSKSSFSASFGTMNPELDEKHLNYIKSFNHIGVREKSGYEYLFKNKIKATKTSDPVFLLNLDEWKELTNKIDEEYILVYEVVNGVNMIDFAKKLSKETGYKVKVITSTNKPISGVEAIKNTGPLTWLSLFHNAKYVVTNSFHGLAFSLIFNKQFFIELLSTSNSSSNNRMIEILDEYGLKDRIIAQGDNCSYDDIDYQPVNNKMSILRKESIQYIESILGK